MSRRDRITYYDVADMNYASFFLTGLSENENQRGYKLTVSRRLPPRLRERMMEGKWARIVPSVCVFEMRLMEKEFYFCIDGRDSCRSAGDIGMGYHLPLLDEVKLYFKVNYNEEAIRTDPDLKAHAGKIVPMAPCFPLRPRRLLPLLGKIVGGSVTTGSARNAASKIKSLARLPSLEEMQRFRNVSKEIDIFFVSTFYGHAYHHAHMEFRYEIMKAIRSHGNLASVVGFTGEPTGKYASFKCDRFPLQDYLNSLSSAKVAIYVRGLHDCLSFKIGQYLALGLPIAGQTISNNRKALYGHEGFSEQFAFDSPREIVRQAVQLLGEPDKRKSLGESNSRIFDTKLFPQATVSEMLECLRSDVS